jgi:hypothetical protein
VNTLTVGRSQQTSGNNGIGVLTFSDGTFDVNTLQIGFQTQSGVSAGIGTVTLNGAGAVLEVNSSVLLGGCGGAAGTNVTHGVLNIFGGTAGVNGIAVGAGSGTNVVAVNGGTLAITNTAGTAALPIDTVALTNASLQLFVSVGVTNIAARHLVTGGVANVVNIEDISGIFGPGQFPLIQYTGAIGGAGFNFKLGALPADVIAGGYLSNNVANSSVDLVITNLLVLQTPFFTSSVADGTNIILQGVNGPPNGIFWLRASANVAAPVETWPIVATNVFDEEGGFNVTAPIEPGTNQLFYLLQLQ